MSSLQPKRLVWLLQEICASICVFVSCLNHALTNTSDKVVWNTTMIESFNKVISNICDHTLINQMLHHDLESTWCFF